MEAMRATEGIFTWLPEPMKALTWGELVTAAAFTPRDRTQSRAGPAQQGGDIWAESCEIKLVLTSLRSLSFRETEGVLEAVVPRAICTLIKTQVPEAAAGAWALRATALRSHCSGETSLTVNELCL